MLPIDTEKLALFGKALSSPVRLKMIELMLERGGMAASALAEAVGITNGAMTAHIKCLSQAGIVQIRNVNGRHGISKICMVPESCFLVNFQERLAPHNVYEISLPVGSYAAHQVQPTCGLASTKQIIGQLDDPRYFDDPQRHHAGILWFMEGYITYRIPNYLRQNERLTSIQITQELASEAPGTCEDWPSEIHFAVNGVWVGSWVSPGDYGNHHGIHTPSWWAPSLNQYGLRKTLSITAEGSFMDGQQISEVTIDDLHVRQGESVDYTLEVSHQANGAGGLTIFGNGFGNYGQDILVRLLYEKKTCCHDGRASR